MKSSRSNRSASCKTKRTVDVQNKLRDYYKTTKEKLLKMKEEKEQSEYNLKKEIEKKQRVSLDYAEMLSENKMLDMLIKGINEKIINAKKRRTFIESEIIKIKNEIDSSNTSIQFLYQQANYKVASVQNEKEQISSFTKKEVDMIKEQIQKEKEINAQLKSDISDIEYKIEEHKNYIEEINSIEGKKTTALLKDTAEMTKFLSQL